MQGHYDQKIRAAHLIVGTHERGNGLLLGAAAVQALNPVEEGCCVEPIYGRQHHAFPSPNSGLIHMLPICTGAALPSWTFLGDSAARYGLIALNL